MHDLTNPVPRLLTLNLLTFGANEPQSTASVSVHAHQYNLDEKQHGVWRRFDQGAGRHDRS